MSDFGLKDLLKFDDIVVQCHDNPDADALASGYALSEYLRSNGKDVKFIYGGQKPVSKSNLKLMIETLDIPVSFVDTIDKPDLLVTVDCQYGESNVTHFDAGTVAVIDHHRVSSDLPKLSDVRSEYGSCSSVLYMLLKDASFDINADKKIATALYYGLMTDTGMLSEINHPADKDLRDYAEFDEIDIILFKNSNISKEELLITSEALKNSTFDENYRFAIVYVKPCDPNILGIISDMLLEVDSVDCVLSYNILPFGVKISVRSCIKEAKANDLAAYICEGYGGGGGHMQKAGGLLKKDLLIKGGIAYEEDPVRTLLTDRMKEYFEKTDIFYSGEHKEDQSLMKKYIKKKIDLGFVPASNIAPSGSNIMIRTLEGDINITVRDDLYIVIGVDGEIYPMNKDRFDKGYAINDKEYVYPGRYEPSVLNSALGERIGLLKYAVSCTSDGGDMIFARELKNLTKVFTAWDKNSYYLGKKGDFLAQKCDNPDDIYIIARDIFFKTYDEKEDI